MIQTTTQTSDQVCNQELLVYNGFKRYMLNHRNSTKQKRNVQSKNIRKKSSGLVGFFFGWRGKHLANPKCADKLFSIIKNPRKSRYTLDYHHKFEFFLKL